MPLKMNWDPKAWESRIRDASFNALERIGSDARSWWDLVAPIGTDPRTSGGLRASWFATVSTSSNFGTIWIHFGSSAPYAIYVELGTGRMAPRAPLRTVAQEVFPLIEYYLYDELNR